MRPRIRLARRLATAPFRLAWRLIRFAVPLAPEAALQRTVWAIAGIVLTMAVGVAGYVLIDDYSPFDALYQTTLTLTTVGFQEVHPLSREARLFTIFLMLFGVGIALYLLAAIATLILEGDLYRDVQERRQRRMIDQLSGHTIFVGAGSMGTLVIESTGEPVDSFVLIEQNHHAAESARARDWLVVEADASEPSALHLAGVAHAERLYILTGDDGANLIITLRAREIAPEIEIITRINRPGNEDLMRQAGASDVFSPFLIAAQQITERHSKAT